MTRLFLFFTLSFIFISISSETSKKQIIDFSQHVVDGQISCLSEQHSQLWISVRAYNGEDNGMFDKNVCNSYKLAAQYPNIYVNIHMIPSPKGSKCGFDQFNEMMDGIYSSYCGLLGRVNHFHVWVTSPENWNKDPAKNVQLIQEIFDASEEKGWYIISILTNENDWREITDNVDHLQFAKHYIKLWLADAPETGEAPQSKDFTPFGGWPVAHTIQYTANAKLCGISCNKSFYP